MNKLIGKTVRCRYAPPAFSCGTSRVIVIEGKVIKVNGYMPDFGKGSLMVKVHEDKFVVVSPSEVTHVKSGSRWRKLNKET